MNDDKTLSYRMKTRLAMTLKLFSTYHPDKIILSGGVANKVAGIAEADAMEKWLVENGMPAEVLVKEGKSLTTKQNAKYAVPMALEMNPDKIILCTSKEHLSRKYLNPKRIFERKLKKSKVPLEIFTNN